jgi:hypothetical protein
MSHPIRVASGCVIALCLVCSPSSSQAAAKPKPKPKPAACGLHCGTERWDIKTLSDAKASKVDFTPKAGNVADLSDPVKTPAPKSGATRNASEMQTYSVRAKLVGYKIELNPHPKPGQAAGDHDFHIVLQDLNGNKTMVVEIPDVSCSGVCSSIKKAEIEKVRSDFESGVTTAPTEQFFTLANPVEVEVTGVAFFDFSHGQTGLAQNCIELHPVLSFTFVGKPSSASDPSKEPKAHPKAFYKCLPPVKAGGASKAAAKGAD